MGNLTVLVQVWGWGDSAEAGLREMLLGWEKEVVEGKWSEKSALQSRCF